MQELRTSLNLWKILIYQNEKGNTKIDVFFQDGEIWMTQKSLADLYQVTPPTIIVLYKTPDGSSNLEVILENENVPPSRIELLSKV